MSETVLLLCPDLFCCSASVCSLSVLFFVFDLERGYTNAVPTVVAFPSLLHLRPACGRPSTSKYPSLCSSGLFQALIAVDPFPQDQKAAERVLKRKPANIQELQPIGAFFE